VEVLQRFNSLTITGAYICHRFSWASLELNDFSNFYPLLCFTGQNVAKGFNLTSGARVRIRASCAEDMSGGSLMGLDIQ